MTSTRRPANKKTARVKYYAAVILILLLAAYIRLSWLDVVEFKYDEAMITRRALDFVETGNWPASTISSIPGIPQPPYKAILLAIPYYVSRNPIVAATFQSLLGILTVAMTAWLGSRYFGPKAGLIGALILATSPWAFFYDRKLWSQNVPVFTIVMISALFKATIDCKPQWIVVSCLSLGALIGFYLGNAILAVIVGLTLLVFLYRGISGGSLQSKLSTLAWAALGVLSLLLVLYPFVQELFSVVPPLGANIMPSTLEPQSGLMDHILTSATIGTGSQFHSLSGDRFADFTRQVPGYEVASKLDDIAVWLIVAGIIYVIVRFILSIAAQSLNGGYMHLALWIAVPVLAWTLLNKTAYLHRYIMILPAQCLAAGIILADAIHVLERLNGSWPKIAPRVLGIWLISLTIWHVVLVSTVMNFVSQYQIGGGHGQPVAEMWSMVDSISQAGDDDLPVVVYADGDDPEHEGSAAVIDSLLGDRPLYIVANHELSINPTKDYINLRWNIGESPEITKYTGEPTSTIAGIARLENGMDILTLTADTRSNPRRITIRLRVWANPPSAKEFGYSIQMLDGNQAAVSKSDAPFLRAAYWRVGDSIIIDHRVPKLAAEADFVMFSMYAYAGSNNIVGVNILDIAGNPAGQQIIIPLK